ncbi:MAG TPA: hypothetical protein VFB58_18275 [Chloroflexota bacterium]|nr:hypothetical protein [Chloroflexota bacterium]
MTFDWATIAAIASTAYAVAFIISIGLVLRQLGEQRRDRFVTATAPTFQLWEEDNFQQAQQWILYSLTETTWKDFTAAHRGDYGERAFLRVGALYNRIGYLVNYGFLGNNDRILLDTLAGPAIAVWEKIAPLVLEARLIENSTLFQDFERMLPRCYECFVPTQPIPASVQEGAGEAARLQEASAREGS